MLKRGKQYHTIIAEYFNSQPYYIDENWNVPNIRKCAEQPFQLTQAKMLDNLFKILNNFEFLQAKTDAKMINDLILDFAPLHKIKSMQLVQDALRISKHILDDSEQLASQLTGRLLNFDRTEIKKLLEQIKNSRKDLWLRPSTPSFYLPDSGLLYIFMHSSRFVKIFFANEPERLISYGEDGIINFWDLKRMNLNYSTNYDGYFWDITVEAKRYIVYKSKKGNINILDLHERLTYTTSLSFSKLSIITTDDNKIFGVFAKNDFTIQIIDIKTEKQIRILVGHKDKITVIKYIKNKNYLISGSRDTTIKIWNLKTGDEVYTFGKHTDEIVDIHISLDTDFIISSSKDKTIKIWDIKKWQLKLSLLSNKIEEKIEILKNNNFIVSSSRNKNDDQCIKIWCISNGELVKEITCNCYIISPDCRYLFTYKYDCTEWIKICEIRENGVDFTLNNEGANSIAFTNSGKNFITFNCNGILKIWNLDNRNLITSLKVSPRIDFDFTRRVVLISPNDRYLIISLVSGVQIWDLKKLVLINNDNIQLFGHEDVIVSTAVFPNNKYALSTSKDGSIRWWDLKSGTELKEKRNSSNYTNSAVVSVDGDKYIAGGNGEWEWGRGKCGGLLINNIKSPSYPKRIDWPERGIEKIVVSPDNDHIFYIEYPKWNEFGVYNVYSHSPKANTSTWTNHKEYIRDIEITPDGKFLLTASKDKTIKFWKLKTLDTINSGKQKPLQTITSKNDEFTNVYITPNNKYLITRNSSGLIKFWNRKKKRNINSNNAIYANVISIMPDSNHILFSQSNKLYLHNIETNKTKCIFVTDSYISSCSVSTVGNFVLVGDNIGHITILHFENIKLNTLDITAWNYFNKKENLFAYGCPFCFKWIEIDKKLLGKKITCSHCGNYLNLNSFSIKADWRPVSQVWNNEKIKTACTKEYHEKNQLKWFLYILGIIKLVEIVEYNCPYCNSKFKTQKKYLGKEIKCTHCGKKFLLSRY